MMIYLKTDATAKRDSEEELFYYVLKISTVDGCDSGGVMWEQYVVVVCVFQVWLVRVSASVPTGKSFRDN